MSFRTKSPPTSLGASDDSSIVPGAVTVTDEAKPRTRSRMDSLVSKLSIKGRSSVKENSMKEQTDQPGRNSASRKDESVILQGTGVANENHIPLNLEKEPDNLTALLQKAIKDQQGRIAQLQTELEEKSAQLLGKTADLEDSQLQVAKLKQTLKSSESMIRENRRKISKIENLKFELEESEETRKVLQGTLADTKRELELAKSEISNNHIKINELLVRFNGLKEAKGRETRDRSASIQGLIEAKAVEEEKSSFSIKIANLERIIGEQKNIIVAMETQNIEQQNTISDLNSRLDEQKHLQSVSKSHEDDYTSNATTGQQSEAVLAAIKDKANAEYALETLRSQSALKRKELEAHIRDISEILKDTETERDELKSFNLELQKNNQSLNAQLAIISTGGPGKAPSDVLELLSVVETRLTTAIIENTVLKTTINDISNDRNSKLSEIEELQTKLRVSDEQASKQTQEIQSLKEELFATKENYRNEIEILRKRLGESTGLPNSTSATSAISGVAGSSMESIVQGSAIGKLTEIDIPAGLTNGRFHQISIEIAGLVDVLGGPSEFGKTKLKKIMDELLVVQEQITLPALATSNGSTSAPLSLTGGQQISIIHEDVESQASEDGAKLLEMAKLKTLSPSDLVAKILESWQAMEMLSSKIKDLEKELLESKTLRSFGSKSLLNDSPGTQKLNETIAEKEKIILTLTEEKKQILNEKQKLGDKLFKMVSNRQDDAIIRESSSLTVEQFSAQWAAKEIEMKKLVSNLDACKLENTQLKGKVEELEAAIIVKIQKLDKAEKDLDSLLSAGNSNPNLNKDSSKEIAVENSNELKNKDPALLPLKIEIHNLKNQLKVVSDYSDKITATSQASISELKEHIESLRKGHAEQLVELDGQLAEANHQIERLVAAKNDLKMKFDNYVNDSGIVLIILGKSQSEQLRILESKVVELESSVMQKNIQIKELNSMMQQLKERNNELCRGNENLLTASNNAIHLKTEQVVDNFPLKPLEHSNEERAIMALEQTTAIISPEEINWTASSILNDAKQVFFKGSTTAMVAINRKDYHFYHLCCSMTVLAMISISLPMTMTLITDTNLSKSVKLYTQFFSMILALIVTKRPRVDQ